MTKRQLLDEMWQALGGREETQLFQPLLTFGDIKSVIELIESNNQYNSDKAEVKHWEKIAEKLRISEEV